MILRSQLLPRLKQLIVLQGLIVLGIQQHRRIRLQRREYHLGPFRMWGTPTQPIRCVQLLEQGREGLAGGLFDAG